MLARLNKVYHHHHISLVKFPGYFISFPTIVWFIKPGTRLYMVIYNVKITRLCEVDVEPEP
jgi:hypothetical protein